MKSVADASVAPPPLRLPLRLLAAAVLTLLPFLPQAAAQARVEPAAADGEAALRLASRLLGPWGDPAGFRIELSPLQLPDDLPVELPLPEGFELLGSLANYDAGDALMHAQIVLDSPVAADETRLLLEEAFSAAGWSVQDQAGPMGFTPVNAHVAALYCAPADAAFIHMNSFGTPAEITDVRLEINTQSAYSPCTDNRTAFEHQPPQVPLPALAAPEGSEITLHGGTYLEDQASSSAVIFTDLPADELLRHFEAQLEHSGWSRAQEAQPWQSIWTLVREERRWRGTLALIDLGGARPQYYASFALVPLD